MRVQVVEVVFDHIWHPTLHLSGWYVIPYLGVLIYWIRLKWNEEESQEKEVEYQMKVENTENDVHP